MACLWVWQMGCRGEGSRTKGHEWEMYYERARLKERGRDWFKA